MNIQMTTMDLHVTGLMNDHIKRQLTMSKYSV